MILFTDELLFPRENLKHRVCKELARLCGVSVPACFPSSNIASDLFGIL